MSGTATTVDVKQKPSPSTLLRWIILIFVSLAMFGNYYIYDTYSPAAKLLKDQLEFSDTQLGWLQGIYNGVNIFMLLIAGFIIDRIGTKKTLFIFSSLCLIGAGVTVLLPNFWMIMLGRLIFGLGAETMIVTIDTVLAKWFKGKELSFAFGVNLFIARLGSVLALNSATLAKPVFEQWQGPLMLGVAGGIVCVVAAVAYWITESGAEKKYSVGEAEAGEKIDVGSVFRFSKSYWFVVALCVTFYSGAFPFQTFAVKFFQEAHGTTPEAGGFLNSVLPIFAMFFTPLFGFLADRYGRRSMFMFLGSLLLIPVFLMVGYMSPELVTDPSLQIHIPWVGPVSLFLLLPMAMMGISFSVIPAVMWPSVAYIVEEKRIGTAYAIMTLIQNIGLLVFNNLIGFANDYAKAGPDNPGGYTLGMWIFTLLGFLGLLFSFMLWKQETGPNAHGLETITTRKKE